MKKTILCVDDERMVLSSLSIQLSMVFRNRFELEYAESAEEAFEIIEEIKAEGRELAVVVTDWYMPHMKGDVFLTELHKTHPHVMKIMLTGHAEQEAVERAREHAALFRCITKPWRDNELTDAIQEAVSRYEKETKTFS